MLFRSIRIDDRRTAFHHLVDQAELARLLGGHVGVALQLAFWKVVKKEIAVRNGLKQDDAKKIVKMIKEAGFKVQVAIMDDIIRVTGKKLDDLQEVIARCRTDNFGIPLQFVNMKS